VACWDYKVKCWWITFKKETQFVGNFRNVGCALLWKLEGKGNLSMVPLSNTLEFSMRSFSCEECVCDIKKRGGEYGRELYFNFCNGKRLMDFQMSSCWCLVSFKIW
jgi:hypothetical protein